MKKITSKVFFNRLLNGMAMGIVVGLIPNAVLGGLFKALSAYNPIFLELHNVVYNIQFIVPALIGFLVGLQFEFNPMKASIISAVAFISSGALSNVDGKLMIVGLGDLINVILAVAIAVLLTEWLGTKLGSVTIILQPIIVGAGVGFLGLQMLPFVKLISITIGNGINTFTTLQPLLMCILIAMSFSLIIVSPISTVAIGIAIGLNGLSSGAANIGVAACTAVLVVGSWKVNKSGVTAAIGLGGMKMMMPNVVNYPIMTIPILITAIFSGIGVRIFNILGDPVSSGFGLVGLVGPIKAYSYLEGNTLSKFIVIVITYFLIPFGVAVVSHILFTKVLKLYKTDIYEFLGDK